MKKLLPLFHYGFLAATLAGPAFGQTDSDLEVYELDPFAVDASEDVGYVSANAITATGVGTSIQRIPMNISVITSELINDRQPLELVDVIDFAAGVQAEGRSIDGPDIRGFRATIQRNGLSPAGAAGYVLPGFLDRVEIIKGASAVFHGLAEPGGIVNYLTKKPQSVARSAFEVQFGTEGHASVMLDSTGPITEGLNYRVVVNAREFDGVQESEFRKDAGFNASLSWSPTPRIQLTGIVEYVETDTNPADELSASVPEYWMNPAAIASGQSLNSWVSDNLGPFEPNVTMYVYEDFPEGREHSWLKNKPWNFEIMQYNLEAVIKLTPDTVLNSVVYYGEVDEERITSAEVFRLNADGTRAFGSVDLRMPEFESLSWENTLSSKFEFEGVTGRVVVGSQYDDYSTTDNRLRSTAGNRPEGSIVLHYTDDPFDLDALFEANDVLVDNFRGITETETYAFFGTLALDFFRDTLHTTLGTRYTSVESARYGTPDKSDAPSELTESAVTNQFGAVYDITPNISVFGNLSESFLINSAVDVFRGQLPPSDGESIDLGLKFQNLGGTVSGTISYYEAELSGIPLRDWDQERIVDQAPIFKPGGSTTETKGYEVELSWTPNNQFQALLAYAYVPDAVTSNDVSATIDGVQVVRTISRRPVNTPEHSLHTWARYSFTEGSNLEGLAIAGGVSYKGEHSAHPGDLSSLFNDSATILNMMFEYGFLVGETSMTARLNLKNITDEEYNDGSFDPAFGRRIIFSLSGEF